MVVECNLNLVAEANPPDASFTQTLKLARIHHYSEAIRLLEQKIEDLQGKSPPDSLLVSVLRLGISSDVDQAVALPECHRRSPLATAQCLNLYGKLSIMPSYAKALHSLVERRGGPHAVKHVGWSDWLVLTDLYNATRTGDRLWYPRVRPPQSILNSGKHVPDAKALYFSKRLGSGFDEVDNVLVPSGVREAIQRAVDATVALDHYYRREEDRPLLADIVLAANEAQREFLELCDDDVSGMAKLVHNCCRLAGLIYNDIVLFPLPSCTRVKSHLAGELEQLLERSEQKNFPPNKDKGSIASPLDDMFIWVLAMGGIAASFTVHRPFFVKQLRSRLRIRSVDNSSGWTWPEFKKLVSRFLWWDPVVDSPAMGLWLKVTTGEPHMMDVEMESLEPA
ncbi:hypothetical protein H2200_002296 [Cladophialophora chaetospira]|uniref:Uncharacterized protein n=1 Tax=Cladophialophora chaetospira TaxID=386627 RepID=A0AA38XIM0_9EURO|nr:hypothetical protein H2200_002296 [Cladophialophora chaetospira]